MSMVDENVDNVDNCGSPPNICAILTDYPYNSTAWFLMGHFPALLPVWTVTLNKLIFYEQGCKKLNKSGVSATIYKIDSVRHKIDTVISWEIRRTKYEAHRESIWHS